MNHTTRVRRVEFEDARLLWEWANDPSVRRFSFNKGSIEFDDHIQWLRGKLASDEISFWIVEVDEVPVAQVRYEKIDSASAEIHFSVREDYRGQGFGTLAIQRTEPFAREDLSVQQLRAIVFDNNPASNRVFDKCGFTVQRRMIRQGIPCQEYIKNCD